MFITLIIILLNIAFVGMLWRLSTWYKIKAEDYWFYLVSLNLVALLMILNEYFDIATDYPFAVKFLIIFGFVFLIMEINKKHIIRRIKLIMNKLKR